ncbi:MAG TPA: DMT family transporter [Burkholderiaceae bacterium]|nr:DMT family transporter [Burkholderiaceae bacterium]HMX11153.1 DMT family transporter [Burkholderiaceae bacterium]HMZ00173.1 DMT family transporter [Burkholderiaceae bacterium]HNB44945.1 DMT family transporter [Burkholderiaceae bacterium]HNG82697.1 DMT family transporter [Burkholderiaceae bacterium]
MLQPRQLGMLVLLTLMWGSNWPMMKFSLREITPLWFRAITMGGGALALALYFLARGQSLRLPRSEWARLFWLALPNIIAWHFFSILGLRELASGRASILGFTMPVWTVLIGVLLGVERLGPRVLISLAAAIAAVGLLSFHELSRLAGRPLGVAWMQLAALGWAAGTVMMRRTRSALPTEVVTVWMLVIGALFFWIVAPLAEPAPQPARFSAAMWASLAWGVFLNYGYAQVLWFNLARELPPSASAFSIMAVPLVGIATATAIVGEVPTLTDALAAACIMTAIASALIRRPAPIAQTPRA